MNRGLAFVLIGVLAGCTAFAPPEPESDSQGLVSLLAGNSSAADQSAGASQRLLVFEGSAGNDQGTGMAAVRAGSEDFLYLAGLTAGGLEGSALPAGSFLAKLSRKLELIWLKSIDANPVVDELKIAPGPDDGIYLIGSAGISTEACLRRIDGSGAQLWIRCLTGGGVRADRALNVAADSSGNVVFVGWLDKSTDPSVPLRDLFVARYDASGNQTWLRTVPVFAGQDVALDDAGNVYVLATSFTVLKYDLSGNLLWTNQLATDQTGASLRRLAVSGDGTAYITGSASKALYGAGFAGGQDILTYSLAADGSLRWVRTFGGADYEAGLAIGVNQNRVFVSSATRTDISGLTPVADQSLTLLKYDHSGDLKLAFRTPETVDFDNSHPGDLVIDRQGKCWLAGKVRSLQKETPIPYEAFVGRCDPKFGFEGSYPEHES